MFKINDLELKMAKTPLKEENHLLTIKKDKKYRGWYKYILHSSQDRDVFKDIFIRFRMPPTIPIYEEQLRNFDPKERLVGIHRMLIGKDLKDDAEEMGKYESIDEYIKTLEEDQVAEMLARIKNIITFDCNLIPYLHIRITNNQKSIDIDKEIEKFVLQHPNYLKIFKDILNSKINIEEAKKKSNGFIYNEFLEINKEK